MTHTVRTLTQIGTAIQRARRQKGWTQTELAKRAGVRQATISLIETGETPAKLDTLLAILAALELELALGDRAQSSATDLENLF